jgi:hypothetical protein
LLNYPKEPIKPGKIPEISIRFDSARKSGCQLNQLMYTETFQTENKFLYIRAVNNKSLI